MTIENNLALAMRRVLANETNADDLRDISEMFRQVDDLLCVAWSIIAASPGWETPDPPLRTQAEWRNAARAWRDRWHAMLDAETNQAEG